MSEESEDKLSEGQQDAEVRTKAVRPPRSGITERLVCQDLFQGTFTDIPWKKLNHLCVAAMGCAKLMKAESEEDLPYDLEQIKQIYALNLSFINTVFTSHSVGNGPVERKACIPWGFAPTLNNYNVYILPWRKDLEAVCYHAYLRGFRKPGVKIMHGTPSYYGARKVESASCPYIFAYAELDDVKRAIEHLKQEYVQCPHCHENFVGERPDELAPFNCNILDPTPEYAYFFAATQYLLEESARNLRNAFEHWSIPILEDAKMEMALFVSPQTYEDIARLFMEGAREEHGNGNGNRKPDVPS